MTKKARKVVTSTPVKKVEYRIIQTTRGMKTKLRKMSLSKEVKGDTSLQGSPTKSSSSRLGTSLFSGSPFDTDDLDHASVPFKLPKNKVSHISCLIYVVQSVGRHKMISCEIGYLSKTSI